MSSPSDLWPGTCCVLTIGVGPRLSAMNDWTIHRLILAFLVLLLAGCDDESALPTATLAADAVVRSDPQHSSPPIPSSSPEVTLSAALARPAAAVRRPHAEPASPLEQAAYLHRIGDYAEEQRILLSLLDDSQDRPSNAAQTDVFLLAQQQEATYRLSLSYLADNQPAQALDTLEAFQQQAISLPAEDPRQHNLMFLRAEALAALGRTAEAVAAYSTFLEQYPQITGPLEKIMAEVWLAAGAWPQAADALRRAAAGTRDNWEKVRLLERLAETLEADGRWVAAGFVYDEIISFSKLPAYRLEIGRRILDVYATGAEEEAAITRGLSAYRVGILQRAGEAYAAAGEEEAAITRWRLALDEAANSHAAYLALIQLVNRDEPVDLFLRGEIDLFAGAYVPAISAFERFLDEAANDLRAGQAWFGIGHSHVGLGQWDDANVAFERVLRDYPNCTCFGEVWLARARLESSRGAPAAGRRIYRTFAREHPHDPLAPEALWRSALSSLAAADQLPVGAAHSSESLSAPFVEAAADLLVLADGFPYSEQAADALSVLGIRAFANGRYAQAISSFERLQRDYPHIRPAATTYWLGRSLYAHQALTSGSVESYENAARSTWQALVEREPDTFYGVLAGVGLAGESGQNLFERVDAVARMVPPQADDDGSQAFAESWLAAWDRETAQALPTTSLGVLAESVATDPDLSGGTLLLALGRRLEGMKLLEQVYWRYRDDPLALYPLLLRFQALGANRLSINAAQHLILRSGASPARHMADAPLFLQRIAYPRHFSRLVEEEATHFGIDPLLFYSLIRQESLFEPAAVSFASAQGLAQIMPSTGAEIAERLNYPNYRPELLQRPFVNIRFGTFYLRWVRDFVNDRSVAALAGYNAGPGNAQKWMAGAPFDDLFMELIPFSETRLYVQQILTHYYHYLRLYHTSGQ